MAHPRPGRSTAAPHGNPFNYTYFSKSDALHFLIGENEHMIPFAFGDDGENEKEVQPVQDRKMRSASIPHIPRVTRPIKRFKRRPCSSPQD